MAARWCSSHRSPAVQTTSTRPLIYVSRVQRTRSYRKQEASISFRKLSDPALCSHHTKRLGNSPWTGRSFHRYPGSYTGPPEVTFPAHGTGQGEKSTTQHGNVLRRKLHTLFCRKHFHSFRYSPLIHNSTLVKLALRKEKTLSTPESGCFPENDQRRECYEQQ